MSLENMLSSLSQTEKLAAINILWRDLSANPAQFVSPDWHGEVLAERSKMIESGNAAWLTVDELQARLMSR